MAKLILTNEVTGLGSAGDVVEVKNGFARNYLIPQGFAVTWTRGGEKQVASIRAARESRAIHDHEEAVALKNSLESNKVRLAVKAGAEGRLFGSVTNVDISEALKAQGLDVPKAAIRMPQGPLKQVGDYPIKIALHTDVVVAVTVSVLGEQ